ncbi:MAG: hypothetical protein GY906_20305, partial [bacterium]|nr:hypothetical protein [bacterium]
MSSHRGRFRSFASVVVAFYAVAVPVFGSGTTDDLEPQVWEQSHSQMESDRLEFRHSAEDGLEAPFSTALVGSLIPGEQSRLAVSWEGVETELTAWVDFDGDGEFAYETERIITKAVMHEGMQAFEFEVPLWAKVDTDARVRFSVGAIWTVDERWKQLPQTHADCKANEASSPVCSWEGDFWLTDLNNAVHSLAVFDDGNGEALYAGGLFQAASGEKVGSIAKWDGASWSSLPGLYGVDPSVSVYTLAVFDDGNGEALYAGGDFTTANGATVNRVARWDGTSWSTLSGPSGIGLNEPVHKLAVYDDGNGEALYAGGEFTSAGGVTVNRIAKWDGTSWSALSGPSGAGVSDSVYGLAVYDDGNGAGLYAGGAFTTASGVTANRIARWDGTSWSALSGPSGTGVNDAVYELAVYDDGNGEALYTGGGFTSAGGVTVNRIAKWDGVSWSALSGPSGTGVNDAVYELAVYDDGNGEALYAGGGFTSAGGVTVNHIAKWDGTSWSALSGPSGTGVTTSSVMAMTVFNNGSVEELYAGGNFTLAGGVPANYIAKWDGASWSALSESSGGGLTTTVRALEVYDDGNGEALYAGGGFTSASGSIVNYIAKWDGASWSALFGPSGTGVDDTVRALAVFDDGNGEALYVGGSFITAGGLTVNRIAKWDGASWSPLTGPSGTGASSSVSSLAVFDDG